MEVEFLLVPAFGSEASPAKLAATGLVLAGIPLGLRRVVYAMLQGLGQPGSASRAETIGLVVMLAGMVPLTAVMGVMGAVVANGAGATVAVVLALWTLMSTIRTSVSQDEIGV
jgi:O-antigen/teichoic acid export membrane protein